MTSTLFDVLIIGGGAVGCAVAYDLSRYDLKVAVVEKEYDVAAATSGRNSGVVHAGFNNKPGSLMAKLCVEGNEGFEQLCKELDVPYRKTGKYVVAFDDDDLATLESIMAQGKANGCKGLEIIDAQKLHSILPDVGGIAALYSPNTAVFDPFLYTVALADNAANNGVEFFLGQEVTSIEKEEGLFTVRTKENEFRCKMIVNSAGLNSDKISAMAGCGDYRIFPCRGEYLILDRIADKVLSVPVYPAPKRNIGGLGVHLTPTIHGNIIIGPSAEYIEGREDYASTQELIDKLFKEAQKLLPTLSRSQVIGAYSGIRSKQTPPQEGGFHDFVIKEEPSCKGLVNLVGIESPGMTASMPIARMVRSIISETLELKRKQTKPNLKRILKFSDQPDEVKAELIKRDPAYGEVVCRCQQVTKKEICQAIENPLGVKTISGIKYRVWATTGRCNGGYCLSRISEILEKEYGIDPEDITFRGTGSELYSGRVK